MTMKATIRLSTQAPVSVGDLVADIAAEQIERAVREIDVAHQAEDQREPARHQEIEAAERDAVEQRVEEHALAPEHLLEVRRPDREDQVEQERDREDQATSAQAGWRSMKRLMAPPADAAVGSRIEFGMAARAWPWRWHSFPQSGPVGRGSDNACGAAAACSCSAKSAGLASGKSAQRLAAPMAKGQRRDAAPRRTRCRNGERQYFVLHSGLVRLGRPIFCEGRLVETERLAARSE